MFCFANPNSLCIINKLTLKEPNNKTNKTYRLIVILYTNVDRNLPLKRKYPLKNTKKSKIHKINYKKGETQSNLQVIVKHYISFRKDVRILNVVQSIRSLNGHTTFF